MHKGQHFSFSLHIEFIAHKRNEKQERESKAFFWIVCKFSSSIFMQSSNCLWACIMMKNPQIAMSYEEWNKKTTYLYTYQRLSWTFFSSFRLIKFDFALTMGMIGLAYCFTLKRWCNPIIRNVLQFSITCAIRNITEHLSFCFSVSVN